MAAGNPLYDLHAGIWTMLEDVTCATDLVDASKHFTDLVKSGSRRKTTATAWEFLKENAAHADYPETVVVQTGLAAGDRALGCNGTALNVFVEVLVAIGEQPGEDLFDVQWAVFRQWQNWKTHLQTGLTWNSKEFVWNVDLLNSEDSLLNTKLNRLIKGWSSVWRGKIHCYFTPTDLIA